MKPDLKYSGIVFTLVNMQTNIAKDTIESVKETFGKHIKVYESYIPIATKVSESAIHGKSIYDFSSDSKASKAYEELTKEFFKDHRVCSYIRHKRIFLLAKRGWFLASLECIS